MHLSTMLYTDQKIAKSTLQKERRLVRAGSDTAAKPTVALSLLIPG